MTNKTPPAPAPAAPAGTPTAGTLRIYTPSEVRGTSACTCYGQAACRTCHGSGRVRSVSQAALVRAYLELRAAYLELVRAALPPK